MQLYNEGMARPKTKEAPLFGQRLASLRKSKGLSQAAFAKLLKTTREVIDYYERRAANPTLDFVQRAACALEVPVTELLGSDPASARGRPGRTPQLQLRFERIRRLPRKDQEFIIKFIDTYLEKVDKA
jgi:transcriptional regulator with XRE-family HTH domain